MLQKLRGNNSKGFTLIELMIVIAIIGILAAIAIPNFIAYRNKSFCSRAESDANGIAAALSDYFSIPTWVNTPALAGLNNGAGYTMSGQGGSMNVGSLTGADPTLNITIIVTDGSTRCPTEFQNANQFVALSTDGWDVANNYYKFIRP
jgi:prepilin-type N-terminal cleavage/methylation domain-containing protein